MNKEEAERHYDAVIKESKDKMEFHLRQKEYHEKEAEEHEDKACLLQTRIAVLKDVKAEVEVWKK